MRIIVFGKDGQLGKAFGDLFKSSNASQSIDIHYVGRNECDLSNEEAVKNVLAKIAPDLIINAAAYTAVDKAETEVEIAFAINANAPELMATYASKHDATLLHFSTDYVFDGTQDRPYLESDVRSPLGIYGKSKAAGEELIENVFSDSASGRFAILRTSWVYGEGQNFIRTILRLAKERDQLRVIHDQYGVPTSAAWLAQVGLDLVLDQHFQLRSFPSGIYHAVPNGETTWHGLARLVIQTASEQGIQLKIGPQSIEPILASEYPLPAPRPQNSRLNNAKLPDFLDRQGDVTKLQHWNMPWDESVKQYVVSLARSGLI
ncbi:dTDP-4-dehydrorhamnose reductase [Polynucleobacter sp. MWH-UH25E]|uniref:dTDP-4-dehydrorhamnose reductase n=1 Tax=Polynucleobacter sp. MWH-UH25E TaxID=1855616 RepID=UPI001BFE4195|nr:dTDP-4-dehydrorhamnose reductase [Polynucleobacter sp. MWH-UH25E]QWD62297.1 dTDP-4-dehydrorhamnose reductase [Polynucleobacter sp. MWH-UH25E]